LETKIYIHDRKEYNKSLYNLIKIRFQLNIYHDIKKWIPRNSK